MNILHIVTFRADNGAFGGPTSVATAQARQLANLGNRVTLIAAAPPKEVGEWRDGNWIVRTFRAMTPIRSLGFAGMMSPQLWWFLWRQARSFDVVHIHLARDLITLLAAKIVRLRGVPYVVQTHGMVDSSAKLLAGIADRVETRAALRSASVAFALTEQETADLNELEPAAHIERIANGIDLPRTRRKSASGDVPTVLFLARMHERKRPVAFVRACEAVASAVPAARFLMVGPDEGEVARVDQAILESSVGDRFERRGGVGSDTARELIASSSVFVLPSVGEVFPMTILEAFREGTPVVVTSSLGIAADCESYGAAKVTDGSVDGMASAIVELLENAESARELRSNAYKMLEDKLSIDAVATRLESCYAVATSSHLED